MQTETFKPKSVPCKNPKFFPILKYSIIQWLILKFRLSQGEQVADKFRAFLIAIFFNEKNWRFLNFKSSSAQLGLFLFIYFFYIHFGKNNWLLAARNWLMKSTRLLSAILFFFFFCKFLEILKVFFCFSSNFLDRKMIFSETKEIKLIN